MLRFRISAHGPKTRSNRARSSFTHFNGPLATTVAARGLSSSSAISPVTKKNSRRYFNSLLHTQFYIKIYRFSG